LAQDAAAEERVMIVNLRPGEACPAADDPDTIVVCEEIEDPYRIPRSLREGRDPENRSWTDRARDMENVGRTGPGSCSNVGAGAELGCTVLAIDNAVAEREQAPQRRYSEQIAAVRAERLATIDADAAITQARVEQIEREYLARLEAERDAALPGDEEPLPQVRVIDSATLPSAP
jgi:hypothetical protein